MAFEQRNNSGSMFKNDRREKETHPNYRGTAVIDGVHYWMDCWIKVGAKGKFLSVSFRPKDEAQSKPPPRQAQGKAKPQGQQRPVVDGPVDDDMEIPF